MSATDCRLTTATGCRLTLAIRCKNTGSRLPVSQKGTRKRVPALTRDAAQTQKRTRLDGRSIMSNNYYV